MSRVVKSFLILFLLFVFPIIACNLQGEATSAPTAKVEQQVDQQQAATPTQQPQEEQPEQPTDQATSQSFLDESYTPKDAGKIILMAVEPDAEGNIQTIAFLLPESLQDAEIVANDVKVDPTVGEDKIVFLDLTEKVASPEVELQFKSGDQTLATCLVNAANLLNPSGDCIW